MRRIPTAIDRQYIAVVSWLSSPEVDSFGLLLAENFISNSGCEHREPCEKIASPGITTGVAQIWVLSKMVSTAKTVSSRLLWWSILTLGVEVSKLLWLTHIATAFLMSTYTPSLVSDVFICKWSLNYMLFTGRICLACSSLIACFCSICDLISLCIACVLYLVHAAFWSITLDVSTSKALSKAHVVRRFSFCFSTSLCCLLVDISDSIAVVEN